MHPFRLFFPFILLGFPLISPLGADQDDVGKPNRLAGEKSPYLLQHARNPVDWYPWGEEAFAKAEKENKLILLSIGYSTCHWCHVMERESFENKEIAAYLNEHFVAIKLDREERPDVDQIYLTAYQAMTGEAGGWPLNMFLTPKLKPLTGGTYFPPTDRDGSPGFATVLKQLQGVWKTRREEIIEQADTMNEQMADYFSGLHAPQSDSKPSAELLDQAIPDILSQIDPVWGGLGTGMKFPQADILRFLIQSGNEEAVAAALKTCRQMRNGGIHDHVGGGFHRYTVDREWKTPHFEKMLYDQAQLMELYLDAWLQSGEEGFREVVEGIAAYVLRDLTHPQGGFFCAQDAQSEGKEGKYFCWTLSELEKLLTKDELAFAQKAFDLTAEGNFLDQSDPDPLPNQNVLSFQNLRSELGEKEEKEVRTILTKLAEARSKRNRHGRIFRF